MSFVIGADALIARLLHLGALGEVAEHAAVDTLGTDVAMAAQTAAPVDTGTLRDSITYEDGRVFTDVEYAPFVEYGTSTNEAQPFLRPAADTVDGEHAAEVAANIVRTA